MASAMRVFRKFQSSDGHVKATTASSVLALVAVLALLIALPVGAAPGSASDDGVQPVEVPGNPDCSSHETISAELNEDADPWTADDYLFEHKTGKPTSETVPLKFNGLSGTLTITINEDDPTLFAFSFSGDFEAAAVIVKGGDSANFYDYRPDGNTADKLLHAPVNDKNGKTHDLSHISFCTDVATTDFVCGESVTLTEETGLFRIAEAMIFANSLHDCTDKQGFFSIDNTHDEDSDPNVKLEFNVDGAGDAIVAGRLDVTKVFGDSDNDGNPDFEPLEYSVTDNPNDAVVLDWCTLRNKDVEDGNEFDDVLPDDTQYPSTEGATVLSDGNVACKVAEFEDATGTQVTVVYFEFVDPFFI